MTTMRNRVTFFDLDYDDTSQEWAMSGGDFAPFVQAHEDVLSQAMVDALETTFNSEPYINWHYGFEGRTETYNDDTDDRPKVKVEGYIASILKVLGPFMRRNSVYLTFDFPGDFGGPLPDTFNGFRVRLQCTLTDMDASPYDHYFTYDATTHRATVT